MKIVILDGKTLNPGDLSYAPLEALGELTVYPETETEALGIQRIGDSEIVLVNKFPVTESLLEACPGIRLICVQATGYNVVDTQACARRGIPVTNVPTYGTAAVAQFTMALILEMCHQAGLHSQSVHSGEWGRRNIWCYWLTPQTELAGKTLGILGFGRIGRAVGKLAKAFGMNVIAYNRSQCEEGREIAEYVDLDTLFARSDILTLHCPLFPETSGIINRENLAKMKDGAMLVNTARGGLLDEQAVAEALASGKLRCAAADVAAQEPISDASPLLASDRCILTPHIAWAPLESRQRLLRCVVENVRCFQNGSPQNVVNPEYVNFRKNMQ